MDIEIIFEPDIPPDQLAELAVTAENYGIRALWASNFWAHWDGFISLVQAAQVTEKIELGVLAISPFEMHPVKIANAIISLNEISQGRSMVAIGGGGGLLRVMGKESDPAKLRIVRAVREAIEIVQGAASGEFNQPYKGELYEFDRPHHYKWVKHRPARVFACATEPQMLRMAGRVADSLQMSDVALPMLDAAMENIQAGLARREAPATDFRIGNFWAWHIKEDREASYYEARRELVFRGSLLPPYSLSHFLEPDDEKMVIDNWQSFAKAFWTRSGKIENVPGKIVTHLVNELSSAGDWSDIDREIERLKKFEAAGLTDISIRLFDDPVAGLKIIGERVVPAFS
ncbi:MAG: LLM class flavin-dependent oxidoreductase [Gammaproteobacteria bacterium]|nr:MAG: LLM class flavin-dependent oxidoreductase [Gammaproteobacteria bacterium]